MLTTSCHSGSWILRSGVWMSCIGQTCTWTGWSMGVMFVSTHSSMLPTLTVVSIRWGSNTWPLLVNAIMGCWVGGWGCSVVAMRWVPLVCIANNTQHIHVIMSD